MNRTQARDAMYQVLTDTWEANAESQNVRLLYADFNIEDLPTEVQTGTVAIEPWALAEVFHKTRRRASIGVWGKFRNTGELSVLIYTPTGDAMNTSDKLCTIVTNTFSTAKHTELRYREVVAIELGRTGVWTLSQVKINFEYDERVSDAA